MDEPETIGHRVVITFANDHDLAGAKVEVGEVTSLQCAVAAYLLERVAHRLDDVAEFQAAQADPRARIELPGGDTARRALRSLRGRDA